MLTNQIPLSKFEDLIGFIKGFMNAAASHLATRRVLLGLHKMEGFYRKKGGARELLTKEKRLFLDKDIFFWGKGTARLFIKKIASCLWGTEDGKGPRDKLSH